jgi:hypothetical protein
MLFSLLYFVICRLLGAGGRRAVERDIELLVLRHQVGVLQRQVKRVGIGNPDSITPRRPDTRGSARRADPVGERRAD